MCVHNIFHMHRLTEGYILWRVCIPRHKHTVALEEVSRINKTKRLSLFVTSVLHVSLQTPSPQMSVYVNALFMGVYVFLEVRGEQPASSQGALVLVYVYTCPQRL